MSRACNWWNPTPPAGRSCVGENTGPLASVQVKAHSRNHRLEVQPRRAGSAVVLGDQSERSSRALILCTPHSSRVNTAAVRLAALSLCNCCASPLWIEIAGSLRAAERKGSEKLRFERVGEISPPDCDTMRNFWGGRTHPSTLRVLWLLPKG